MIAGLHEKYDMQFNKKWGLYYSKLPSGLGDGWMTVFMKEDIHFIRTVMNFHETVEFSSHDPVSDLVDIRIRTGGDLKSSFLSEKRNYTWDMFQVNAVSAFVPIHYFKNQNHNDLKLKVEKVEYDHPIKTIIDKLLSFQFNNENSALNLESELLKYCYHLLDFLNKPIQSKLESEKFLQISKLRAILDEQYVNPPVINQLARQVGMNTTDLQQLFKTTYGKTIKQYSIDLKIKKAVELIVQTNLPITQVSLEVGYQNRSHFNQLYKNRIGLSPSEHRKTISHHYTT